MNADSMLVRRERMYGHCGFRLVPYTSQGSAATVLKCGVMFDDRFTIGILLPRLVVERIFKIGHHLAALPAVVVYTGSVLIHVSQWSGVFFCAALCIWACTCLSSAIHTCVVLLTSIHS